MGVGKIDKPFEYPKLQDTLDVITTILTEINASIMLNDKPFTNFIFSVNQMIQTVHKSKNKKYKKTIKIVTHILSFMSLIYRYQIKNDCLTL